MALAIDIIEKGSAIEIVGFCTSSCAEYLLPAASEIWLIDNPIIGTHGNPLITLDLAKNSMPDFNEHCLTDTGHFRWLQGSRGVDPRYNRDQVDRLGQHEIHIREEATVLGHDCALYKAKFNLDFWSLTASEVAGYFRKSVKGSSCADSQTCRENNPYRHRWPRVVYTDDP